MVPTASQVLIWPRREASSTQSGKQGEDEHRELARLVGVHAAVDEALRQPAAEDGAARGDGVDHGDGERPADDAGNVRLAAGIVRMGGEVGGDLAGFRRRGTRAARKGRTTRSGSVRNLPITKAQVWRKTSSRAQVILTAPGSAFSAACSSWSLWMKSYSACVSWPLSQLGGGRGVDRYQKAIQTEPDGAGQDEGPLPAPGAGDIRDAERRDDRADVGPGVVEAGGEGALLREPLGDGLVGRRKIARLGEAERGAPEAEGRGRVPEGVADGGGAPADERVGVAGTWSRPGRSAGPPPACPTA
jgi:hypothetical protein